MHEAQAIARSSWRSWFMPHRLPMIMQTEAAECGLACLAMIANHAGHTIDLPALRRRYSTSARGVTLGRLIAVATDLGFNCRPIRIELGYLARLETPTILHWNLNHFVVLKRVSGNNVEVHDPARGVRRMPLAEAGSYFTGVALELRPMITFQPVHDARRFGWLDLTGPLPGLKSALSQILILALALQAMATALPFFVQLVLDHVLVGGDTKLLASLVIAFALLVSLQAIFSTARGWAIAWLGGKLNAEWASNVFAHLMRLPLSYFETRHVGDLTSRFSSIQAVQRTMTGSFAESVINGITGIATLLVLALLNTTIALVVLSGIGMYAALRWLSCRMLWQMNEQQLVYLARQQTTLLESVRGIQAIKLANKQGERAARFATVTLDAAHRDIAVQRTMLTFSTISQWLFGTQRITLVWFAAQLVLGGHLSIGMLTAYVAFADQLSTCASVLIDRIVEFRMLGLHAERIADIALSEPEEPGAAGAEHAPDDISIELDNVSFRYASGEPWILRNCSLRIGQGESVAIIGPSGCGKTTLLKIILGLLVPTEGVVRVGGIDIHNYGLSAYRRLVAAVMQDDQLFEGSIADNISFLDDRATLDAVRRAAVAAAIDDEISTMPMRYETLIGNMGATISGGQKQRLLLARALYRAPRILALDEATSHLDAHNEHCVNEYVRRADMTRIVVAHRKETISSCDRQISLAPARSPASSEGTTVLRAVGELV